MLGTLATLWLMQRTWDIIIWVVISLMFVATFNPVVRRMQQRIGRGWAVAGIVAVALLVVLTFLGVIIPSLIRQGHNLVTHLPSILDQVQAIGRRFGLRVNLSAPSQQVAAKAAALLPQLLDVSLLFVSGAVGLSTIFIMTVYLLLEGPQVGSNLLSLMPRGERLPLRRMFSDIGVQVGAYVRGQLITSTLAGLFALVALSALRVPEALALAFLMAVADLVPIVGALIGTTPAVLMALSRGTPTAVLVLVLYIIYLHVESNLLVPWIYGSTLKLSPFVVLVALLVGAKLMGMLGALLALPAAAAVPIIVRYISEWRERADAEGAGPIPLPSEGRT